MFTGGRVRQLLLVALIAVVLLATGGSAYGQTVETAEQGLTMLERVQAGGVPLICLALAALCGVGFYWQLKANKTLHEEHFKTQGDLLREMLTRDKETITAHMASTRAIEDVTTALRESKAACDATNRRVDDLASQVGELKTEIRRLSDERRS